MAVLAGRRDGAHHGEEEDRGVADREDRVAQLLRRPEVLLAGVAEGEAGGQQGDGQQRRRRPGGAAQGAELEQLGADEGDHDATTSSSGVDVRSKKTSSRFEDSGAISYRTTPWSNASWPMASCVEPTTTSVSGPSWAGVVAVLGQHRGQALVLRRADPHARAGAAAQRRERAVGDQPAVVDDHDLVDGLGDLGQHVAREQHRAALGGQVAQEVAQPADALGVEAVGGLVEHEDPGIAEQRGGEAEPLGHAEREAAGAAARGVAEVDELEHLVGARERDARLGREHPQVVAGRAGRMGGGLEHDADLRQRVGAARRSGTPWIVAVPEVGVTRPTSERRVVVLPDPFGPRKPTTLPSSMSKLRSSTARTAPKSFVRF